MSANTRKKSKHELARRKAKRELEIKKAKRNKKIGLAVLAAVVLVIIIVIVVIAVNAALTEIYTDGAATIILYPNGEFSAVMYHYEMYDGTYAKSENGTRVTFSYDGMTSTVELNDGFLQIPLEWDDGHSHAYELPRQ